MHAVISRPSQRAKHGYRVPEAARGKPKQTRSSAYTCLLATAPDRFLVAYDRFDCPDARGQPRKAILVRRVVVKPRYAGAAAPAAPGSRPSPP